MRTGALRYILSCTLACALALLYAAAYETPHAIAMGGDPSGMSPAADQPQADSGRHLLDQSDYLLVQFSDGRALEEFKVQVDSAGEISLPVIGYVKVGGLTPRDAAELLKSKYTIYYRQPTVSIQLLSYGQIEVFVFGVDFPGRVFNLNNGTRMLDLISMLYQKPETAQAVQEQPVISSTVQMRDFARYRRLHVVRGGFDLSTLAEPPPPAPPASLHGAASGVLEQPCSAIIDKPGASQPGPSLAGYQNWRPWIEARLQDPASQVWLIDPLALIVEGDLSRYNVVLKDQDALFIPAAERYVDVEGTSNPGRFELLADESLGDVLRLAGTPNRQTDLANAVVQRYDDCGRLTRIVMNLLPALDDLSAIEGFKLQSRDRILIMPREERIFIMGEVKLAGAFAFQEDSTVLDYIALAGGETVDANLAWIAVIRQNRDRIDPQAPAEVLQLNFKSLQKGLPACEDLSLLPGDVIWLPPKGFTFNITEAIQAASIVLTGYSLTNRTNTTTTDTPQKTTGDR